MKKHQRGHIEAEYAPWQPLKRIRQWIRQWLCSSHRFDLADMKLRDAEGIVRCRCYKCGGVFAAEYGLGLPGAFDRNTTAGVAPNEGKPL
jgi:hypothetical protein